MVRKLPSLCDFGVSPFRIGQNIRNLNGFAFQQYSAAHTATSRRKCQGFVVFNVLGRVTVARRRVVACVFPGRSQY